MPSSLRGVILSDHRADRRGGPPTATGLTLLLGAGELPSGVEGQALANPRQRVVGIRERADAALNDHAAGVVDVDDEAAPEVKAGVVTHPHLVVDEDPVCLEAAFDGLSLHGGLLLVDAGNSARSLYKTALQRQKHGWQGHLLPICNSQCVSMK